MDTTFGAIFSLGEKRSEVQTHNEIIYTILWTQGVIQQQQQPNGNHYHYRQWLTSLLCHPHCVSFDIAYYIVAKTWLLFAKKSSQKAILGVITTQVSHDSNKAQ